MGADRRVRLVDVGLPRGPIGSDAPHRERFTSGNCALRACCAASVTFAATGVLVAGVNVVSPFERGWWLAAYLLLVGGASQLLLGGGQYLVAARRRAAQPHHVLLWTQLALWNAGTATVATADMARVLPAVAAGSASLMAALALFLVGLRAVGGVAGRRALALEHAYMALLLILAACVVVGTFLAGASRLF